MNIPCFVSEDVVVALTLSGHVKVWSLSSTDRKVNNESTIILHRIFCLTICFHPPCLNVL